MAGMLLCHRLPLPGPGGCESTAVTCTPARLSCMAQYPVPAPASMRGPAPARACRASLHHWADCVLAHMHVHIPDSDWFQFQYVHFGRLIADFPKAVCSGCRPQGPLHWSAGALLNRSKHEEL